MRLQIDRYERPDCARGRHAPPPVFVEGAFVQMAVLAPTYGCSFRCPSHTRLGTDRRSLWRHSPRPTHFGQPIHRLNPWCLCALVRLLTPARLTRTQPITAARPWPHRYRVAARRPFGLQKGKAGTLRPERTASPVPAGRSAGPTGLPQLRRHDFDADTRDLGRAPAEHTASRAARCPASRRGTLTQAKNGDP